MAIFIQCPSCREKFEFENTHGGKSLACKCGKKLEIPPAAEDGSDIKQCPFCKNTGDSAGVICLECGYNFNTGRKLKASGADEPEKEAPATISKIIPVIKFVVVPLVVLIVGYLIYNSATGKNYGISKNAPLGTFQKLEKELTEIKYVKSSESKPIIKEFGVEGKIYTYVDENLRKSSKGFITESISCAVDSQGGVVGIIGTFFPPGEGIPTMGSTTYLRMLGYWQDEMEFAKKPDFTAKHVGEGAFGYNMETATAQNQSVQAKWIKEQAPTALQASSDTMMFSLKEYKIDFLNPALESLEKLKELFKAGGKTDSEKKPEEDLQ